MAWSNEWNKPNLKPETKMIVDDWHKVNRELINHNFLLYEPSKQITVYLDDVATTVKVAEIIGDLAVHEHLEVWGKWSITHVPTQVSFMKAVPDGAHTKEHLINWCMKVQEAFQDEWNVLRSLTKANYLDDNWTVCRAKELIQAHCKNTRVG